MAFQVPIGSGHIPGVRAILIPEHQAWLGFSHYASRVYVRNIRAVAARALQACFLLLCYLYRERWSKDVWSVIIMAAYII